MNDPYNKKKPMPGGGMRRPPAPGGAAGWEKQEMPKPQRPKMPNPLPNPAPPKGGPVRRPEIPGRPRPGEKPRQGPPKKRRPDIPKEWIPVDRWGKE